jgi:hypothetical protein
MSKPCILYVELQIECSARQLYQSSIKSGRQASSKVQKSRKRVWAARTLRMSWYETYFLLALGSWPPSKTSPKISVSLPVPHAGSEDLPLRVPPQRVHSRASCQLQSTLPNFPRHRVSDYKISLVSPRFRTRAKDLSTTFIQFSFTSQFCVRNALILLNVYKERGVETIFRYGPLSC